MAAQEPTIPELEEAITHLSATCQRYSRYDRRYGEWHEEINHLLTDRDQAIARRKSILDSVRNIA
jgi:hypothetical protein